MEESLRNPEELEIWFHGIKKWSRLDDCDTRRVWLDIYGVPPYGWLWGNFNRIAGLWGRLICLGKPIYRTDSFDVMRVLIATDTFQRIE